jgi:hypothetical protein
MKYPFSGRVCRQASRQAVAAFALFAAANSACIAIAQTQPHPSMSDRLDQTAVEEREASFTLPDAPGEPSPADGYAASPSAPPAADLQGSRATTNPASTSLPEASHRQRYPLPGQPAPVLTPGDKAVMGLQGALSLYAAVGWLSAAGYEQMTNTTPNYGTDRGAYGQRLGASAIRAISEDVLADSVLAPAFHEDPRYYRLGSSHRFFPRLIYAVSRSFITRNDQGRTVPNFSQIGGNLIGAVLTNAYYPQVNRTATQTVETFGGSLGGTALGDGIAEFFGGILFDHHARAAH